VIRSSGAASDLVPGAASDIIVVLTPIAVGVLGLL
jgi:hypothetical protein